jgi:hypothetical protein
MRGKSGFAHANELLGFARTAFNVDLDWNSLAIFACWLERPVPHRLNSFFV